VDIALGGGVIQRFGDAAADDVAPAHQALVAGVHELDHVRRPVQQGHAHRRFLKQRGELAPALVVLVVVVGLGHAFMR